MILACLQIYQELLLLVTFLWVYSNSKEVSYLSWQNKYPNLKTTSHVKLKCFLWTKLLENLLLAKYFTSVAAPLTSIIRTGLPILVELIDLVNSVIIFLSQMTWLKWLTFLLRSWTVILIILLFWIYFLLLMLVFVLQGLSLHWEILIILLCEFPFTFHQIVNGMPCFIT